MLQHILYDTSDTSVQYLEQRIHHNSAQSKAVIEDNSVLQSTPFDLLFPSDQDQVQVFLPQLSRLEGQSIPQPDFIGLCILNSRYLHTAKQRDFRPCVGLANGESEDVSEQLFVL